MTTDGAKEMNTSVGSWSILKLNSSKSKTEVIHSSAMYRILFSLQYITLEGCMYCGELFLKIFTVESKTKIFASHVVLTLISKTICSLSTNRIYSLDGSHQCFTDSNILNTEKRLLSKHLVNRTELKWQCEYFSNFFFSNMAISLRRDVTIFFSRRNLQY